MSDMNKESQILDDMIVTDVENSKDLKTSNDVDASKDTEVTETIDMTQETPKEEFSSEVPELEDEEKAGVKLVTPTLEQLEQELQKETYKNNYGKVLRSTIFSLIVVAAVAVLIAVLILPVLQINGTSMTETLYDGDIVVSVNSSKFETGDIIAFYHNNSILVKRVIAEEGDWVDIDEKGNVSVNGVVLNEPYLTEKAFGETNIDLPYQVPDGKCFVMGDHRATSIDSRNKTIGAISDDMVIGKIVARVWPLKSLSLIK